MLYEDKHLKEFMDSMDSTKHRLAKHNNGNSTMGKAMKLQTNLLGKGLLPKRNNMTGKAMKLHTNSTVDKEKNGLGGRKIPWMITFGGNGPQEAAGTDGKAKVQQRVMGRMCTMVDFAR